MFKWKLRGVPAASMAYRVRGRGQGRGHGLGRGRRFEDLGEVFIIILNTFSIIMIIIILNKFKGQLGSIDDPALVGQVHVQGQGPLRQGQGHGRQGRRRPSR